MSDHPLIYVDLIEELPQAASQFAAQHPGIDDADTLALYRTYRDDFQPFRILIKSGDNHTALFRSTERYFNRADALHAINIGFGNGSNVYLRQHEVGNIELRLATQDD